MAQLDSRDGSSRHAPGSGASRDDTRSDSQVRSPREQWKLVLSFGFFAICAIVALSLLRSGGVEDERALTLALLSGGFVVMGVALLPVFRRGRSARQGPHPVSWVFLLSGMAMWCISPVLLLANGHGWAEFAFGGSRRDLPIWLLAVLLWGVSLLMLAALVVQLARHISRARRHRTP